jgi:hypothetical protein
MMVRFGDCHGYSARNPGQDEKPDAITPTFAAVIVIPVTATALA